MTVSIMQTEKVEKVSKLWAWWLNQICVETESWKWEGNDKT